MIPRPRTNIMSQLMRHAAALLTTEGASGLARRMRRRIGRSLGRRDGYILGVALEGLGEPSLPCLELEVKRVRATDDDELDALATFGEEAVSKARLVQRLTQGQRCYIARSGQHLAACQWVIGREFQDGYLERPITLAREQVYLEGAFTAPAFRGQGIMACLILQSLQDMARESKTHAITFVAPDNTSSLRTLAKVGATRIGRIGFIEILGIRFHYLFGRTALPRTTRRFYFARTCTA